MVRKLDIKIIGRNLFGQVVNSVEKKDGFLLLKGSHNLIFVEHADNLNVKEKGIRQGGGKGVESKPQADMFVCMSIPMISFTQWQIRPTIYLSIGLLWLNLLIVACYLGK